MNLLAAAGWFILAFAAVLGGATRVGAHFLDKRNPPVGAFAEVNGTTMHFVHVPAGPNAGLPPIVFIHGASGNLNDQMIPLRPRLEGRAELLFIDRPGHGWSSRGPKSNGDPFGQAATIAALMDRLGIKKAVISGHSFGGATAAAFALKYPEKTAGLVFIAAATHPWPGGKSSFHYELTTTPIIGPIFSELLAFPAGKLRMKAAIASVFSPNPVPDGYAKNAEIELVLRPATFRANAHDVEGLYRHTLKAAPRYGDIKAPTVIVSGDRDTVVYEEIHSAGLARDIPGAKIVWVKNLGHKPDWITPELVTAAIETVSGKPADLDALAKAAEARLAGDDSGPYSACKDK